MPELMQLLSRFRIFRRVPVPSLKNYVLISLVLTVGIVCHAYRTVTATEDWNYQIKEQILNETGAQLSPNTKAWLLESFVFRFAYFCLSDQLIIWVVVNTICCLVVTVGCTLRWLVFGQLRPQETQQLRDKFWNFVFYKFVFVFGVLNATYVDEVALWTFWFMIVGLVYLLTALAQDRFKYMSSSLSALNRCMHRRILVMTSCFQIVSILMLVMSVIGGHEWGIHCGLFLGAEALMLTLRSSYCTFRYCAYLYDLAHEKTWDQGHSFVYYSELLFEIAICSIDLLHHIHMLILGQIVLSMASLVMLMQIRFIYQKIDARLRRHTKYVQITQHMDQHYPIASGDELNGNEEACAICWDRIESARKLPCGHFFHHWCLHSWLEQDSSCPTCRTVLAVTGQRLEVADRVPLRARRFNHFFHFDGRRYARWLPSFSVEVSHNLGAPTFFNRSPPNDSQLTTMAEQVSEMFPQLPSNLIMEDLRESGSVQTTVENVLEGRVALVASTETDRLRQSPYDDDGIDNSSETSIVSENRPNNNNNNSQEQQFVLGRDQSVSSDQAEFSNQTGSSSTGNTQILDERKRSSCSEQTAAVSLSTGVVVSGRFSKSSDERELILYERKRALIDIHRRRYLWSERGADIRHLFADEMLTSPALQSGQDCNLTHRRLQLHAVDST